MKNLPQHIENQFFKFLNKETSIEDFEQWVYATDELETVLSADLYQELIAFNYKSRYVLATLCPILMDCLDYSKFETYRIIYLLNLIIEKDDLWTKAVKDLQFEWVSNYFFLNCFDFLDTDFDFYKDTDLITSVFMKAKDYSIQMKHWLISGTIIIGDREGHRKGSNYIDNRTVAEVNFY
jgi:hypothetical protein